MLSKADGERNMAGLTPEIERIAVFISIINTDNSANKKRKGFSTSLADRYKRSFKGKGCLKTFRNKKKEYL